MECLFVEAHTPLIDLKGGSVSQSRCVTTLPFQLLQTHWVAFQAKKSVRSALASTALHTEATTHTPQIVT